MNVVVTGAANGLGAAICSKLPKDWHICKIDHAYGHDVRAPHESWWPLSLDVLINCAGVNKIGWLEDFSESDWDQVLGTNAYGIFAMTKRALPALSAARGTVLNIVSDAAHRPMRGSAAYNASKGAAHILTLQLARELFQRHGITVFGISPNKLKGTGMSRSIDEQVIKTRGWTAEQAQAYQLAGLAIGEETEPLVLAEFIAFLLSEKYRHKYLHGCIIPYGA